MVKYFCDSCGKETSTLSPVKMGINWVNTSGLCKDPLQLDGGQCCADCATTFLVFSDDCRQRVFASVQSWLASQLIAWKKRREKMVVMDEEKKLCCVCTGEQGTVLATTDETVGKAFLVCSKHIGVDLTKPLGSMAERGIPGLP